MMHFFHASTCSTARTENSSRCSVLASLPAMTRYISSVSSNLWCRRRNSGSWGSASAMAARSAISWASCFASSNARWARAKRASALACAADIRAFLAASLSCCSTASNICSSIVGDLARFSWPSTMATSGDTSERCTTAPAEANTTRCQNATMCPTCSGSG